LAKNRSIPRGWLERIQPRVDIPFAHRWLGIDPFRLSLQRIEDALVIVG
jgi:hypothetical protein